MGFTNMKLSRIFTAACAVCMLAGFAVAAPAPSQDATKDRSALVDEAPATKAVSAAATDAANGAVANGTATNGTATNGTAANGTVANETVANETAATKTAKAACDSTAASSDSGSDFPVVPVVISSIATIAFVILAIIF